MNWRGVRALVRKDLKVVMQNKGVSIPLIVVPVIVFVVVPALVALLPRLFGAMGAPTQDIEELLTMAAPPLREALSHYSPEQAGVVFMLAYVMAPLFLIVPLMVANVIAADSFVGERERKTLEALLHTPLTDGELMVGKMLSAWLPAVAVSWLGFVVYGVTANLAAWPVMGRVFFPTPMWIVLALWVAPAAAGLGLVAMILVSARAKTFQEAYQLGGVVVLPVILLVIGQISGVVYLSVGVALALGLGLWVVDGVLLRLGARNFHRNELIARL
ncbi:MAG: ABC transporter permease subunit [Anaerolineae bacterium]|nr:ABC transporter permease subunit [Anaerolineae bacterium]